MDRDRSPRNVRAIVRRHRWTVAGALCAGLALASAATLVLPRSWCSAARVDVSAARPLEAHEFATELEAAADRIRSPESLAATAAALGLEGVGPEEIAAGTRVVREESPGGAARLRIEHTSSDATVSRLVAEKLVAGFRREIYDRPREEAEQRIAALRAGIEEADRKLAATGAAVEEHAAKHADLLGPLDAQRRTVQQDLTQASDEVREFEARVRTAEESLAAEPRFQKIDVRRPDPARLAEITRELDDLTVRLEELTAIRHLTADHPDVRTARARVAELNRAKDDLEASAPVEVVLQENPVHAEHGRLRDEAQAALKVAKQRLQSLHRTDRELQQRVAQVPPVRAEHERLVAARDAAQAERDAQTKALAEADRELAGIEASRTLEFTVAEEPAPPRAPAGPHPALFALGGLALGAAAGLAAACAADSRDRSFRDVDAAAAFLGIPALGAVGEIELAEEAEARRRAQSRTRNAFTAAATGAVLLAGWAVWAGTQPPGGTEIAAESAR